MFTRLTHRLGRMALPLFERLPIDPWRGVPRPPATRAVTRGAGPDADRVLLLGGSSAVGWGVVNHELALAGHLARSTSAHTGRGTDVEVYADPKLRTTAARKYLTSETISRYDAIVLTLGSREAFEFMPPASWASRLTALLDHIAVGREVVPAIIVVGVEEESPFPVPRIFTELSNVRAHEFNALSRAIVADRPRVHFLDSGMVRVENDPPILFDANKADLYERTAHAIVPTLAALLEDSPDRLRHPVNETARRRAVDHVRSRDKSNDGQLVALLVALKDLLSVRSADLYFVDRDVVWMLATTTGSIASRPRDATLSTFALEHRGGLVIPDLAADERLSSRPEVTGPPYLRFYAAHPVESPDGHRVGVLAVVDTEPRNPTATERSILRDFALRAGALLFTSQARTN